MRDPCIKKVTNNKPKRTELLPKLNSVLFDQSPVVYRAVVSRQRSAVSAVVQLEIVELGTTIPGPLQRHSLEPVHLACQTVPFLGIS